MSKVLVLTLLLSLALLGCTQKIGKPDESLDRIRKAGILRVATDPSYPPFSFLDGQGQAVGYDVELAHELASRLGVKAAFVGIDITSVFDALIAKKADIAISAVNPAWEYSKEVGFSRSYFNAGQVFIVRHETRLDELLEEPEGAVLGVEIGSGGELEARKRAKSKPGVQVAPFDSIELALDALSSGRISAIIADRVTAALLLQTRIGLRIAGEPITNEPYVVAARRSDRSLLLEVDRILDAMAGDGYLTSLEKRHLVP